MRSTFVVVALLVGSVRELCAAPHIAPAPELQWVAPEHTTVPAQNLPLIATSASKLKLRERCFRACSPDGGGGEHWASNSELTAGCSHTIQGRELKIATLEAMDVNKKGNGRLPIDYGAWNVKREDVRHQMTSFTTHNSWRAGITWDDVVNSTAATGAPGAAAAAWVPPSCVMGTHFGGSDGIGMDVERTLMGNVIGTLLGCAIKCAPILSRIRHSVVYAHHLDGSTTYCHHAGKSDLAEKKLEKEAIENYTKSASSYTRRKGHASSELPLLPYFWLVNMRCYHISQFQRRLNNIVPCWSAEVATGLPHATMSDPPSLEAKHDVLTKLFELPRSPQNQVLWDERVAAARALVLKTRAQQRRRKETGGRAACFFAPPRAPAPSPAPHPGATAGAGNAGGGVLTIAVHIRNGDIAMHAMTRLQLCFVRRVCGVLQSKGFRTQVHIYSETHRATPTAGGTFPEFGDMLVFEPLPNGTSTPPWCGDGSYHHSLARLRGLPASHSRGSERGRGSAEGRDSSALHGVRVTLNGNPLDDIVCMADAEILISGTSSSFSGVSASMSSGLKLRFAGTAYRKSGRELREMLLQLIPEDVQLEYDYPQACYASDGGALSESCKGRDNDWGSCPPLQFDEPSFVREVERRRLLSQSAQRKQSSLTAV